MLSQERDQELFTLWLFVSEGEIGRYRIAKMLDVSQGVARGLLARMKREGLITVHHSGAGVSKKGINVFTRLMTQNHLRHVERLDEHVLGLGQEGVVFQVEERSEKIGRGIEQRDAAVRAGATGTVTFVFDGRSLVFPGTREPLKKRSPMAFDCLKSRLEMRRGDAVLISFSNSWWEAARGGFAAVKTLS